MRSEMLTTFAFLFCLSITRPAAADEASNAAQASPKAATSASKDAGVPDAARIAQLVKQLSAPNYADRKAAADGLRAIGVPALKPLVRIAGGGDPELRGRAKEIIEAIENSLDGLLFVYQSHDLPLPPKNARLIRYETRRRNMVIQYSENGGPMRTVKPKAPPGILAFEAPPKAKGDKPYRLRGLQESRPDGWDLRVEEVPPEPAAVEGLELDEENGLFQAIQCHARGWDALANYLLKASQSNGTVSPRNRILRRAWGYWVAALVRPEVDRVLMAKQLHNLLDEDQSLSTEQNRQFLQDLQAAIVPSRARPGSVEALIDDLVNYNSNTGTMMVGEPGERYWRIARLGFEAVPALIEHLDDRRLTRAMMTGFNNFPSWNLRVRDVVSDLLEGLAGGLINRNWLKRQQGYPVAKADAQAWWAIARKTGEEQYILKYVLEAAPSDNPNPHFLAVIKAKYPKRLVELYRIILDKHPELDSWSLADAVRTSELPNKHKLELLRVGAVHKNYRHKFTALSAMRELDREQYNSLLLDAVTGLPTDVPGEYWKCPEATMAQLVPYSADPRVWSALEAAARRASVGLRLELLNKLGYVHPDPRPKDHLRLLIAFLDDKDLRQRGSNKKFEGPCAGFNYEKIEVRDYAAQDIAWLVGIESEVNGDRTLAQWEELRKKARAAADRVLHQGRR